MKKKFECAFCEEEFIEDKQCIEHEISHGNFKDVFEKNLNQALTELDQKYLVNSVINNIDFRCYDDWDFLPDMSYNIEYKFEISTTHDSRSMFMKKAITEHYSENYNVIDKNRLIKIIEQEFFMPELKGKYEGKFLYESYSGGDGADDFLVGEVYMKTIFQLFKDKNIRIEVID
jgi:hypothetical protein